MVELMVTIQKNILIIKIIWESIFQVVPQILNPLYSHKPEKTRPSSRKNTALLCRKSVRLLADCQVFPGVLKASPDGTLRFLKYPLLAYSF